MAEKKGVLEGVFAQPLDETAQVYNFLFPREKGSRKRMVAEAEPELILPLSVLTLLAGKFKSKTLAAFEDALCDWTIAKERKGRLEGVEIGFAARRPGGGEGDSD